LKDEKGWADWYVGESPSVEFLLDVEKYESSFKIDRKKFNVFETENFKNVQWGYISVKVSPSPYSYRKKITSVVCNDIIISKELDSGKSKFNLFEDKAKKFVIEEKPSLLFDDFEGLFPIKLDRNDIDCSILPFEKELYKEVAKTLLLIF